MPPVKLSGGEWTELSFTGKLLQGVYSLMIYWYILDNPECAQKVRCVIFLNIQVNSA